MSKPIIAVVGATGLQGGSVVRYLLSDPQQTFAVRGLTRNPESEKAKKLRESGVDVVQANLDDPESLKKAFRGVYGVFAITDFWEHTDATRETNQGKNQVDAAKAEGIQHFIWSTVSHIYYDLNDPEKQPEHIKSKHLVDDYLKESGVPYTLLATGVYYENIWGLRLPKVLENGDLLLDWGVPDDSTFSSYSVGQVGGWVLPIFKDLNKWNGQNLEVFVDNVTAHDWAALLSEYTTRKVQVQPMTKAEFLASRNSGRWPLAEHWIAHNALTSAKATEEQIKKAKEAYPEGKELKEWLMENAQAIVKVAIDKDKRHRS